MLSSNRLIIVTIAVSSSLFKQSIGFLSVASSCHLHRHKFPNYLLFLSKRSRDEFVPVEDNDIKSTTLHLYGETTILSETVCPPHENILDFFELPHSASLLLRGSKNNEIVEITNNIDEELLRAYDQQCRNVNAILPGVDDRFYNVTTSGVSFPGLQIMSLAIIGSKVVRAGHAGFPEYEFVLIRDVTYAKGSRLFVWFFNKVAGNDKDKNAREDRTTQSLNRIRVIPLEDKSIAFECNANLSINIDIPTFLSKIIPNKEKAEETGSNSLVTTLKGDIPDALSGFRQEYIKWRNNNF